MTLLDRILKGIPHALKHQLDKIVHSEPMHHGKGVQCVLRGPFEDNLAPIHRGIGEDERKAAGIDKLAPEEATVGELLTIEINGFVGELRAFNHFKFRFHTTS